jgi:hypothetical protein
MANYIYFDLGREGAGGAGTGYFDSTCKNKLDICIVIVGSMVLGNGTMPHKVVRSVTGTRAGPVAGNTRQLIN